MEDGNDHQNLSKDVHHFIPKENKHQLKGEMLDSFITDLNLLACGLDMKELNKLVPNAMACKSLDKRVR